MLGYIAEYTQKAIALVLPAPNLPARLVFLLFGLGIMCFGSAMYMNANLGVSTYDAIALIVSERQKKLPFRLCRILTDLLCVLGGCALFRSAGWSWQAITAAVGPATVVTAFFMGPLISFFAGKLPNYRAQPRR